MTPRRDPLILPDGLTQVELLRRLLVQAPKVPWYRRMWAALWRGAMRRQTHGA